MDVFKISVLNGIAVGTFDNTSAYIMNTVFDPFIFPNRSQRNLPVLLQEQLPGAQMWETNMAKSLSLC